MKKAEDKDVDRTPLEKIVHEIKELAVTVAIFFPIWFFFYFLVFELRSIPSESMVPNLQVGDRVAVSKFAYGYSKYSVPLGLWRVLPLGDGRLFAHEPERGDVVVFRHPHLDRVMIKRLMGLPGDTIQVRNNRVYLNGEVLPEDPQRRVEYTAFGRYQRDTFADEFLETNPEGKSYLVHDILGQGNETSAVFKVPKGYYFFMGDNRDNSADAREPSGHCLPNEEGVIDQGGCPPRPVRADLGEEPTIGFVPFENLIGRADIVLFTLNFCDRYKSGCPKGRVWKSL